MIFIYFVILISLTALNAQIVIDEFQLSNFDVVSHLRVEYNIRNNALEANSITYSLWKGKLK